MRSLNSQPRRVPHFSSTTRIKKWAWTISQEGIDRYIELKFGHPPHYFSTADFAKDIDIKGLLIHDKRDRIIPYQDALDINAQFKNAQLISTEGLGHSLKGDFVSDELIKFLRQ